jgi:hypothetical protein
MAQQEIGFVQALRDQLVAVPSPVRAPVRRFRLLVAAAALSLLGVAALSVVLATREPATHRPHQRDIAATKRDLAQVRHRLSAQNGPAFVCSGSVETESQAASEAKFTVYEPHAAVAGWDQLQAAQFCSPNELRLTFGRGSIYESANRLSDPDAAWAALARQDPATTSTTSIHGTDAAVIKSAEDGAGGDLGSVTLVLGSTWLVVEGDGSVPASTLVSVAGSLQQRPN